MWLNHIESWVMRKNSPGARGTSNQYCAMKLWNKQNSFKSLIGWVGKWDFCGACSDWRKVGMVCPTVRYPWNTACKSFGLIRFEQNEWHVQSQSRLDFCDPQKEQLSQKYFKSSISFPCQVDWMVQFTHMAKTAFLIIINVRKEMIPCKTDLLVLWSSAAG